MERQAALQAAGEALGASEGAEMCWQMRRRPAGQKVAGRGGRANVLSLVRDHRRARQRRRRRRGRGDSAEEELLLWRTAMARRTPRSTSAGTITASTFGDAGAEAAAAAAPSIIELNY